MYSLSMQINIGEGWILNIASSILCVCGCLTVFIDDLYRLVIPKFISDKYPFELQNNYTFSNGALAFSSGSLLLTSLFKLLPKASEYLHIYYKKDGYYDERWLNEILFGSFFAGILVCILLNSILYIATSRSVVHCVHKHDNEHGHEHEDHRNTDQNHDDSHTDHHVHSVHHNHFEQHSHRDMNEGEHLVHNHISGDPDLEHGYTDEYVGLDDESSPLIKKLKSKKSLIHYFDSGKSKEQCYGECKGYTSAELCLYHSKQENTDLHYCEIPILDSTTIDNQGIADSVHSSDVSDCENSSDILEEHHHHIQTPLSRLLLIAVQTCLAIALHKFPEGFITYVTGQTDEKLGFSIFLSLAAHNFTEGFSMCLPMYFSSTSSNKMWAKCRAVLITGLLGGLSSPCGALLGFLFLRYNKGNGTIDIEDLYGLFGSVFAMTSGFLSFVALSMFGSATSFSGGGSNFVLYWSFVGMSVIAVSTILTSE